MMIIYNIKHADINIENNEIIIKVEIKDDVINEIFESIKMINTIGPNLVDFLKNNIDKINRADVFIKAYNRLKPRLNRDIVKRLVKKIGSFGYDYKNAFELFKILKENDAIDSEILSELSEKAKFELNYLINTQSVKDIKEFMDYAWRDEYKEFLIEILKASINEYRERYLLGELKSWLTHPQYCHSLINFLWLIDLIIQYELANYVKDALEKVKHDIIEFNEDNDNKLYKVSIERIKKDKYTKESLTLIKLLEKTDATLLKYLIKYSI